MRSGLAVVLLSALCFTGTAQEALGQDSPGKRGWAKARAAITAHLAKKGRARSQLGSLFSAFLTADIEVGRLGGSRLGGLGNARSSLAQCSLDDALVVTKARSVTVTCALGGAVCALS